MKNTFSLSKVVLLGIVLFSCAKEDDEQSTPPVPMLNITFVMDANAARLNNFGDPATVPPGNAAQHPDFETLGIHFIGLYPDKFTPYENGATVFSSPTTEAGGTAAIDFKEVPMITGEDNTISIPLGNIASGTYEYFRSSIGFQQYQITYNLRGAASTVPAWPNGISDDIAVEGTLASFVGFNTYIEKYTLANQTVAVNANKRQGYFGLASTGMVAGQPFENLTEGNVGQTTVPNPISDTSPVPAGSCVVTGRFPVALTIPENPTEAIDIQVIVSINNSFEWQDGNGNDTYEPFLGEAVVDMGTRGVFPSVL